MKMDLWKAKRFKRLIAIVGVAVMTVASMSGCGSSTGYKTNEKLDTTKEVTLVIGGEVKDFPAMDVAMKRFKEAYPNCKVKYEYIQDYNEILPKRLESKSEPLDLFLAGVMREDSPNIQYAEDLLTHTDAVDLTDNYKALVDNFKYTDSNSQTHLYSIPMGAEMRGMYVNTTILAKEGIQIPTNRKELFAACEKLKQAGYIPLQDNPANFGQRMSFPYIVHMITQEKDKQNTQMIANCEEGTAEYFEEPLKLIYELTSKGYYKYKYTETELHHFLDMTNEAVARDFLNIAGADDEFTKQDDIGNIPFMTAADSLKPAIDKVKQDYHSKIEYKFILAPVTDEGGFAHVSPTNGLAVNNRGKNIDWALEFMNFFFSSDVNKEFAEANNVTSNTEDATKQISEKYDIDESQISDPSKIAYDYNLYSVISPVLLDLSKSNNPKYMDKDDNGNSIMYDFSHYLDILKEAVSQQHKLLKDANK